MARSGKGAGTPLLPIAIIAAVVVAVMVAVFIATGTEPPAQATIIPEEEADDAPAGAGTAPEGEADETNEGVTDVVDEVTPVAPGEQEVPAADEVQAATPDEDTEGETDADEQVMGAVDNAVAGDDADGAAAAGDDADSAAAAGGDADGAAVTDDNADGAGQAVQPDESERAATVEGGSGDEPRTAGATQAEEAGSGGADGQLGSEGSANPRAEEAEEDTFLMDDDSDNPTETPSTTVPSDGGGDVPPGRDARTQLDPEPGEDVVRDTDEGGAAFIPTPSGPDGRDGSTIISE